MSKPFSLRQQIENMMDFVFSKRRKALYTMARALLSQKFSRSGRVRHDELKR
jgi:hypothetical protein